MESALSESFSRLDSGYPEIYFQTSGREMHVGRPLATGPIRAMRDWQAGRSSATSHPVQSGKLLQLRTGYGVCLAITQAQTWLCLIPCSSKRYKTGSRYLNYDGMRTFRFSLEFGKLAYFYHPSQNFFLIWHDQAYACWRAFNWHPCLRYLTPNGIALGLSEMSEKNHFWLWNSFFILSMTRYVLNNTSIS